MAPFVDPGGGFRTLLSFGALQALLEEHGLDSARAAVGAAIALAESGGDPSAVGDGGTSFGLFQIHLPAHPEVSQACALDPSCAAAAAVRISAGGADWTPWTTFRTGAYQNFLQAIEAVKQDGAKIRTGWLPGVTGVITQLFGEWESVLGINAPHTGIDISAPPDSPVAAAEPATVVDVQHLATGFGNSVKIRLQDGTQILFGHLADTVVRVGDELQPGDLLGHVGSTGASTATHLHFQVWDPTGKVVDPWPWLATTTHAANPLGVSLNPIGSAIDTFGKKLEDALMSLLYLLLGLTLLFFGLLLVVLGSIPWDRVEKVVETATPAGRVAGAVRSATGGGS